MRVPISWVKDFVDIDLPIESLAQQLTLAGLEVEEIIFVGLPLPKVKKDSSGGEYRQETKISGLEWNKEKIVVGAITEVMPHPNADRLVLCRLDDGEQEHIALTGAPNLFPFKGAGILDKAIKVAYAREGATLYDGHKPGKELMTLKRTKIRGVESYSMACSEKELGISEAHEGVIILDEDAPVGMPLADYMGDVVLEIAITPNIARDANIYGVAREIAAVTGKELRSPDLSVPMEGSTIDGQVSVEIREPKLNPRFVLGLIEGIEIHPSPYEVQRRLHLAGMRPINNIVDATNYAMIEIGEPLHAFDYDVLLERAKGAPPKIITRTADPGETLTTLDDIEHELDDFTVLVCDSAGALSIAGVMGGAESEVTLQTRRILLEGAAWNFTNIRRTIAAQRMTSEAAYRFSRGVHPALAEDGVLRGLALMHRWAGGVVAQGLVDSYPLPPEDPLVEFSIQDVERWLGIKISSNQIEDILTRLEFQVQFDGEKITAQTPAHRLDIGKGIIGIADLMEEIARIYGYDRIPETRLADALPPQHGNPILQQEEMIRDILVRLGLQEIMSHRLTNPENENRISPDRTYPGAEYLRIANPIASDRIVMRQSLLASVLEIGERNSRISRSLSLFELGAVYLPEEGELLPKEPRKLAIFLSGSRDLPHWEESDQNPMDFYDLKGIIEGLLEGLHIHDTQYKPYQHPTFHPGKCALVHYGEVEIGVFGEIHPLVKGNYDFPESPVLVADLNIEAIAALIPDRYYVSSVPVFPPVLEDLAFIVDENIQVQEIVEIMKAAGGTMIAEVNLFDVYRGGQAGSGKKSLAFSLKYQDPERTLTDKEVSRIRNKIINQLSEKIGAELRS
ncbi:MAG: phenylalanine--tRNA ligase subunit beta [Anaerolineales bacterium]